MTYRNDHVGATVQQMVVLGPMPTTDEAIRDGNRADEWEALLNRLVDERSLLGSEVSQLLHLFPGDESDCFGLAWTLLHAIETSPDWPVRESIDRMQGHWADSLRQRLRSAGEA